MCDEYEEENLAVFLAEQLALNWDTLPYEQRETFRLSACSLIVH